MPATQADDESSRVGAVARCRSQLTISFTKFEYSTRE